MVAVSLKKKYDGEIYYKGELIKNSSPKAAIERGFSMVPEDRKDKGLILSHSVQNNIQMTILDRISRLGMLCGRKGKRTVGTFIENLNIKTSGMQQKVGMLSGGNQQKVVLAKCMAPEPKVILLDEPTRGVDVGAKAEMKTKAWILWSCKVLKKQAESQHRSACCYAALSQSWRSL